MEVMAEGVADVSERLRHWAKTTSEADIEIRKTQTEEYMLKLGQAIIKKGKDPTQPPDDDQNTVEHLARREEFVLKLKFLLEEADGRAPHDTRQALAAVPQPAPVPAAATAPAAAVPAATAPAATPALAPALVAAAGGVLDFPNSATAPSGGTKGFYFDLFNESGRPIQVTRFELTSNTGTINVQLFVCTRGSAVNLESDAEAWKSLQFLVDGQPDQEVSLQEKQANAVVLCEPLQVGTGEKKGILLHGVSCISVGMSVKDTPATNQDRISVLPGKMCSRKPFAPERIGPKYVPAGKMEYTKL